MTEKKYGVHPTQIGAWKRAAIENMATAFTRRGAAPEQVSTAEVDKLHSKIGQLVVGSLNRTLMERQNWIAASEKTGGRPGRPSRGASQVISLSTQIRSEPRFLSDAL